MSEGSRPRRGAAWLCLALSGCGLLGEGPGTAKPPAPSVHRGIEHADSQGRPRLALIERAAVPSAAGAFGVAHDQGAQASAALAALVEARLGAQGYPEARAEVHRLGFVVTAPLGGDAGRFLQSVRRVLITPVGPNEPALAAVKLRLASLATYRDDLEDALGPCSGALAIPTKVPLFDLSQPGALAQLESWRQRIAEPKASALAVVGPSAMLAEARAAHAALPSEPDGNAAADAWPSADLLELAEPARGGVLSVALRVANPAQALEAAEQLTAAGSSLRQRLEALGSNTLDPVLGITRPRGGCVQASLRLDGSEQASPARLAVLLEQELRRAVEGSAGLDWRMDDGVLRSGDPREVAGRAAWRALSGRQSGGETRRFIGYRPALYDAKSRGLSAEGLRQEWQQARATSLPLASQVEPGHGGVQLLLATPCAPRDEDLSSAGSAALWTTSLARAASLDATTTISPWITPHGVGVLVSAHSQAPEESADALARRAAEVLGRNLTRALDDRVVVDAREALLGELGGKPDAGWQTALTAVAGAHPSWLDPRGSWADMNRLNTSSIERRRQLLLRGPWRAALLSGSPSAAAAVQDELRRWLWPHVDSEARCAASSPSVMKPGLYRVTTTSEAELEVNAWVVAELPSKSALGSEAELMLLLLNRPGGWLEAALRPGEAGASAQAQLLGGGRAAALAIGIRAEPDRAEAAVAQVRALLGRLAQGAVTRGEFELARRVLRKRDHERTFDPAFRTAALWLARPVVAPAAGIQRLKQLQRSLAPARHVVVITTRRD